MMIVNDLIEMNKVQLELNVRYNYLNNYVHLVEMENDHKHWQLMEHDHVEQLLVTEKKTNIFRKR